MRMGEREVIEVQHLSKGYGQTLAVSGVSLTVCRGEIFGVIGPQGAGKSTLIELLIGIRQADSGMIRVLGRDVSRAGSELKSRIGFQLQEAALYEHVKVKEALKLFQSYYSRTRSLEEIITLCSLQPYLNHYVNKLPKGWQQRTSLAIALVNDPEILFLDELTVGLDVQAQAELWRILRRLQFEGKTIVFSTPHLAEAKAYCDRAAFVVSGRVYAAGTPEELAAAMPRGFESMQQPYSSLAARQKGVSA